MSKSGTGAVPPYGVPIRDAIASGDLAKMRDLYNNVRPALEELGIAIGRPDLHGGVMVPYGCAIRDAMARGELHEMQAAADAARAALNGISYAKVTADNEADVRTALSELDHAIASARRAGGNHGRKRGGPLLGGG